MPLIVKPISANLVKDHDFLGKADPYCIILVGNEKQRTRTCSGGGKQPTWTDTLQFSSTDPLLRIQVWDDDTISDDMIGEGTLNLNQFYNNPMRTENEYIDLINRGRSTGRVLLSIEYQGQAMGGGGGWGGNQGGNWGGNQGGNWGPPPNQGGWGGNQGGWGGNQGGWGGNQGGYGGNQGGGNWGPPPNQGGWGGNQGGWGGNQGYGGGNQGGNWGPPQNQGGWGGNQGNWGNNNNKGGWGGTQGGQGGNWGNNKGGWGGSGW